MADILQGEGGFFRTSIAPDAGFSPSDETQQKWDNLVMVEGEPFFGLLVTEREGFDTHQSGVVEINGQRFPVWRLLGASGSGSRAYYGKPWRLGIWTPQTKANYYLEIFHHPDDGDKKERKAIAFLQDKGLVLEKVWREPIWAYGGCVSLTYAEYCQATEMSIRIHLQNR